jgi:hypothetical protein
VPIRSSALDVDALARARELLASRPRPQRTWPAVAAAALLAVSALTLATAMILAPPLISLHVAATRGVA